MGTLLDWIQSVPDRQEQVSNFGIYLCAMQGEYIAFKTTVYCTEFKLCDIYLRCLLSCSTYYLRSERSEM